MAHTNKVGILDENLNPFSQANPVPVDLKGLVDSNNDTTTPLLSGQSFVGAATDITDYASIGLMIYTDVNSADDGLVVQYSFDGVTWRDGEAYTIPADTTKFFTPPKQGKYYRVSYTNNGSDQSEFHIHCLLSKTPIKWSSHNLNDNLNDDDDGELSINVLKLRTAQNQYVSAAATGSGNFKTSIEEFESATNPVRSDVEGGGKVSVGTTAVQVTFSGTPTHVLITADIDNTGVLYVGKSDVTSTGANAITYLQAGDAFSVSYNDSSNPLYVVADSASQNFWKGALL